jgi:hypothetical protein
MASLAICLAALSIVALSDRESAYGLLNPLTPRHILSGTVAERALSLGVAIRLICWINWWLVVVNLIPAFPFDGGRALLAVIQSLKPRWDRDTGVSLVAACARIVALMLLIMAFVFHDAYAGTAIPSWLPLVLLSIFVFFGARIEEFVADDPQSDEAVFGYDFSQGYTSLERSTHSQQRERLPRPGVIARWWRHRQQQREARRVQIEQVEDQRMDEILQRMLAVGYDRLSPEEQALLKRVSARYRSREKH